MKNPLHGFMQPGLLGFLALLPVILSAEPSATESSSAQDDSAVEAPPGAVSDKPLIIRGDRAVFHQLEGTGVYEGNAELQQGERHLYANRITILTRDGELVQVEAEGNPVRFNEGEQLSARGNRLVYDVAGQQIRLTGEALIEHLGRTFEGGRIDYNVRTREVEATGEEGQQVILVIPAEDNKTTTPQPDPLPSQSTADSEGDNES